jgi:outer membrane protein assembly factor BamB
LDADSGKVLWDVDFAKRYGATPPLWGVAAHPLVDGNLVYCVVGADEGVVMAFDKETGRQRWRALSAREQGYCPPTIIEHAGIRQLLIWHADSFNSLNPQTGKLYWSAPLKPNYGMAITTPRKLDSSLLVSGFGVAAMFKLDDARPAADVLWRGRPKMGVFCSNSTPFLENGVIYGCDIETGALMGVRIEDGERLWQTLVPTSGGSRRDRYGTAFIVKHQDRFFLFSEKGDLILANLTPQGYDEISRFHVLEPTNSTFGRAVVWSHPAFANRHLFARNDKELVCVSLAK